MVTIKYTFINGPESAEVPSAGGDPATDFDLVSKSYADKNYSRVVDTVAALKAIAADARTNSSVVFVKSLNGSFYFDSASALAGDDKSVVAPTTGTGRWFRAHTTGTANHVQTLDADGKPSSEATLAKVRGGTGQNNSSLTFPTTGTIATLTGTETFDNKTLSAAKVANYLDLTEQVSAPAAPSAGFNRLYFKDDGKVYKRNSLNVEAELGSGGGGGSGEGEKNYITNNNAETNATTGWTVVGSNLTFTAQTTNIIEGAYSFRLSKSAANASGSYLKFAFSNLEKRHQGRILRIKFPYLPSTNFLDGDLKVSIYDVTNAVTIEPAPTTVLKSLVNTDFVAEFQTPVNSTSFELRLTVSSTNALAWDLEFDSCFVGPSAQRAYAGVSTDWQAYTPVISNMGTCTNVNFQWRREGPDVIIRGNFNSGTPAASPAQIGLPTGLLSSSTYSGIQLAGTVGRGAVYASETVSLYSTISASQNYVSISGSRGSTGWIPTSNINVNVLIGAGEAVTINARVQVQGWSSSSMLLSSEADSRVCAARAYATANRTINNTTVCNFDFVDYDTHGAITTGASWNYKAPMPGMYRVTVNTFASPAAGTSTCIIVNGTPKASLTECGTSGQFSGSCILKLNVGDLVAMRGVQATSATLAWNTNPFGLAIQIDRLSGPSAVVASEQITASYSTPSAQAIANAGTIVVWTTRDYDSHALMNTTTGLFTCATAGKFRLTASVYPSGAGTASVAVAVNGTDVKRFAERAAVAVACVGSVTVSCNAGDTIGVRVYPAANGTLLALASVNWVNIERVG